MIKVNNKEIEFTKFPNGETNMNHLSFPEIEESTVDVVFKYEEDGDLIRLMFVKEYLDSFFLGFVSLLIYSMPYGRMDRSENDSPFTLKYVSKFINSLGFHGVDIIEPHSNVTTALIDNSAAHFINFDLINEVMTDVDFNVETDYIMFPDGGASSRYKNMKFPNILIGHKNRDFTTGKINGLDVIGDLAHTPNKVIIVDDLSSYGGTFVHSSKKLKELGFNEVYLLVAHAENSIFKGELFDHVDKVFTTDSMLTEQDYWENKKFQDQLVVFELRREEEITID